jgi:hypothetical protein
MSDTPETDEQFKSFPAYFEIDLFCRKLERERDEARGALREIWQSGDAFLPHVDRETTSRWRKAAGWDEAK